MSEIASKQQLRLSFLRWAVVTVPLLLLLGFTSARIAPAGAQNRWYAALAKPAITPPDWVFPVAWSLLYILMGLALAMIIHARGSRLRGAAITLFAVQFLVNLIWAPLFFGMHQVGWALAVLVTMLALALATTLLFARIRTVAAWLMVPYLLWTAFAGVLLYQIIALNPNAETLVPPGASTQVISL